jgi:curved DNA-binding protein
MPAGYKDYYQTLGVNRSATPEEIKKAFRRLAREHHPDRAPANRKAAAEAKFKEINEAYEVLGDPENRRRYDNLGAGWQQPPPSAGGPRGPFGGPGWQQKSSEDFDDMFGGTGFSSFFEQFFGRGFSPGGASGTGGAATQGGPRKSRRASGDIEADLRITLEEAVQGSHRQISYRRNDPKTGEPAVHTYNIKIPAGIHEGQKIRLAGQGNGGDLYLNIRFLQHPDFRREGDDLFFDLDLAPWEAVLGGAIPLQTLDGKVNLRIKPATQAGQTLRLNGLGLHSASGARGDMHVIIRIQVPEDPAPAERALWEKLANTSRFNPRE